MLRAPNEPLPGQPVLASDHAAMVRYVKSTTLRTGRGGLVVTGSGGATLRAYGIYPPRKWPLAQVISRPFWTSDVGAGGANGMISVSAGSVTDLTNSSTVWTGGSGPNQIMIDDPIYGSVPFAIPVLVGSGPATRLPQLQIDPAATCDYLHGTVDSTTGFITALDIEADTGGGMPASDDGNWYALLSSLTVTITGGKSSVGCLNDGAQSSLYFRICGAVPITDGTQYTVGT